MGAFQDDARFVSGLRSLFETSLTLDVPTERWLLAEDIPNLSLVELVRGHGLLELGVWPIYSREEVRGAIIVARTRPANRITAEMSNALVDACAAQVSLALDMIMALRIAEHASQRDLLTGAWNRRGIESRIGHFINSRSRLQDRQHVILGLVDVDNFKEINDTYGHPTGDRVLRNIVHAMRACVETHGLIGRLGATSLSSCVNRIGTGTSSCCRFKARSPIVPTDSMLSRWAEPSGG
ncbi:GGDEF domain-containing protein [Alicyclobacillus sacchari]|uniref:GGDEF domain-containing protein n=1 Tax=Alicyclobacillus sacchari TaxID=392010 RepID=UPI0024E0AA94|nr:GGDEF domain-containing protein [Alicyclobacillus sacchari]